MNLVYSTLKKIDKHIGKHIYFYGISKWAMLSIPTAIITYANLKLNAPQQDQIKTFFNDHPYWLLSCFLVPLVFAIWLTIYTSIVKQYIPFYDGFAPRVLIEINNRIVDEKLEYIKNCHASNCNKRRGAVNTSGKHFIDCALNPKQSIKELIKETSLTLQSDYFENKIIKICLVAAIPSGKLEYIAYYPTASPHAPTLDVVNNPEGTFFKHLLDTRQPDVIGDIEKELKRKPNRYKKSSIPDHNKGSIIGIPIYFDMECGVKFLLTIKSDEPGVISEKNKDSLLALCGPIIKWILLDHHIDTFAQKIS